jgi:hypothetical protein
MSIANAHCRETNTSGNENNLAQPLGGRPSASETRDLWWQITHQVINVKARLFETENLSNGRMPNMSQQR